MIDVIIAIIAASACVAVAYMFRPNDASIKGYEAILLEQNKKLIALENKVIASCDKQFLVESAISDINTNLTKLNLKAGFEEK